MAFRQTLILFLFSALGLTLQAQITFPTNGPRDPHVGVVALLHATVIAAPGERMDKATVLLKDGYIQKVGRNLTIPSEALQIDLAGKTIYAGFIDLYSHYGMPEPKAEGKAPTRQPQMLSNKPGAYHWNEALKTDFRAHEHFEVDPKAAKSLRKNGFTVVNTHRKDGISRGSSTLVMTGEEKAHEMIINSMTAHQMSLSKGTSTQRYPTSLMGVIALIRQTYLDAQWYQKGGNKLEKNISLQAWNELTTMPTIFEINDKLDILRIANISNEFGNAYIAVDNGDSYQRAKEIADTKQKLILTLNYPKAYDVSDPFAALEVDYPDLKHWQLAPANAKILAKHAIPLAFSAYRLEKSQQFWPNLRQAVQQGLSSEVALAGLTTTPASWIGATDKLGKVAPGYIANLVITDGDIWDEKTKILQTYVHGQVYDVVESPLTEAPYGTYDLVINGDTLKWEWQAKKSSITLPSDTSIKVETNWQKPIVRLSFSLDEAGYYRLMGTYEQDSWQGKAQDPVGNWITWKATTTNQSTTADEQDTIATPEIIVYDEDQVLFPFTSYGWSEKPSQRSYLIKHATVWTNESTSILNNTDILIEHGRIAKIGQNLNAPTAIQIDATGKHVTAGIVDEHSHIGISRGVNEASQECTAEVRIGDVVNCDDVNLFRHLAGGVTTIHQLHGSANPIGGQTALIKLRWGASPAQMKYKDADGFIKFALGENVKQSNWGNNYRIRYPQSRMGVEQVFEEYFHRAEAYRTKKKEGGIFRKDLELEALQEILESRRFITCHSYVQSEINMLMHVAERHDFRVNTFTHILEGYKVADKLAEHGAAGSTFSDWWAYKFEVNDAIPYNAAILYQENVLTGINSDDAEMGRRLNQEAGKTILYGEVPTVEALKMVTLNPAKMLHIDDRVGSIKVGKDADIVLWSHEPLSVYAHAEKTWVDGILYYDIDQLDAIMAREEKDRQQIIQAMLKAISEGAPTQSASKEDKHYYHCDDVEVEVH